MNAKAQAVVKAAKANGAKQVVAPSILVPGMKRLFSMVLEANTIEKVSAAINLARKLKEDAKQVTDGFSSRYLMNVMIQVMAMLESVLQTLRFGGGVSVDQPLALVSKKLDRVIRETLGHLPV